MILLPAETLGRKQNHMDISAGSHFSWKVVSAGSKRSRTVSAEAGYDGKSPQEAKISGLVYTLCVHLSFNISSTYVSNLLISKSDPDTLVENSWSLLSVIDSFGL